MRSFIIDIKVLYWTSNSLKTHASIKKSPVHMHWKFIPTAKQYTLSEMWIEVWSVMHTAQIRTQKLKAPQSENTYHCQCFNRHPSYGERALKTNDEKIKASLQQILKLCDRSSSESKFFIQLQIHWWHMLV